MKNQFIVTLLIVLMSGTIAMAQTKKPTTTTTKKPTTTVKSSVPKTTTTKKTTTTITTTTTPVAVPPPVVEEKKTTTTTTTTTTPTETKSTTTPSTTTTTTTTQSSGPSKGKKTSEPKPERVREPKPERVREPRPERVREPRPEKVRTPRDSEGGIKFGIRAEANQFVSFEQGAGLQFSPGFNAGLIVNIPISEKIAVQPEVLYSMASVKSDYSVINGNAGDYVKNTASSILAPVLLNINLGNGPTKFMINLGGYAEYGLSASSEESTSGVKTTMTGDLTGVDRFFYGVAGGFGVKLNNQFTIETRSFYDLKVSNSNSIFTTLGIGYMF